MTHYVAGATWMHGTNVANNVTGECPHRHRTPEAAQRCIDRMDRAIARANPGAYCDRVVIEVSAGHRHVWHDWEDDEL